MSTRAETLRLTLDQALSESETQREAVKRQNPPIWDLERFAADQMRGLVLQVFLPKTRQICHQVVLTGIDVASGLDGVCWDLGRTLAAETGKQVCVVTDGTFEEHEFQVRRRSSDLGFDYETSEALRSSSRQISSGLWQLPLTRVVVKSKVEFAADVLRRRLDRLRMEFDFSVIQAPAAGFDGIAALLGQLADGVIVVLEAHRTRRLAAKKALARLRAADVRLLGVVLSQRTFPIPEKLYRCL